MPSPEARPEYANFTMSSRSGVLSVKPPIQRVSRRPAHFWGPLNDWWRSYFAARGTRPVSSEVLVWFNENGDSVWGDTKPSWKETRIHAKCLRSTEQVKNYFRGYRARKSGEYKDESKPSGDDTLDIKVEVEEEAHAQQLPARCLLSRRPPLHTAVASAPTPSDCAAVEHPLHHASSDGMPAPDPTAATASVLASLNLSRNPMTITTGRWQHRSSSECFPPGFRAQLQELRQLQEQPPCSDPSLSSIVFHTPSLSAHSRKPVSPFILTQGNNERASDTSPASSFFQDSTMPAGGPKAQSFSCSSKRRHTNDGAHSSIPTSPTFVQHAASFSQVHSSVHPSQAHYSNPFGHCQQPKEETEEAGPFFSHGSAPSSNLQHVSYHRSVAIGQGQPQGGSGLHDHNFGFRHLSSEEPDARPQPQQPLMDRQLVEHIARDAAVRSSMIEQAAQQPQQPSAAALMPGLRSCSERAFYPSRPQTCSLLPSSLPAVEPIDAELDYFWGMEDKEQPLL